MAKLKLVVMKKYDLGNLDVRIDNIFGRPRIGRKTSAYGLSATLAVGASQKNKENGPSTCKGSLAASRI